MGMLAGKRCEGAYGVMGKLATRSEFMSVNACVGVLCAVRLRLTHFAARKL